MFENPYFEDPFELSEEADSTIKELKLKQPTPYLYDDGGNRSPLYDSFASSAPGVRMGLSKQSDQGFVENMKNAWTRGWKESNRAFALTVGNDQAVKANDFFLQSRPDLERPYDAGVKDPGWWGSLAGQLPTYSLPIMGAVVAGTVAGGPVLGAGLGISTTFARLLGDNYDQMMKETHGEVDPMEVWGAAATTSLVQAVIETGLGAEAGAGRLVGRQLLTKILGNEGSKSMLRAIGRGGMLSYGKGVTGYLVNSAKEGMEEFFQKLTYDTAVNSMTGKGFSPFSEYMDETLYGFAGGLMMNIPLGLAAMKARSPESIFEPLTEEKINQVHRRDPQNNIMANEAFRQLETMYTASGRFTPEDVTELINTQKTMAYNLAYQSGKSPRIYVAALSHYFAPEALTAEDVAALKERVKDPKAQYEYLKTRFPGMEDSITTIIDQETAEDIKKFADEQERKLGINEQDESNLNDRAKVAGKEAEKAVAAVAKREEDAKKKADAEVATAKAAKVQKISLKEAKARIQNIVDKIISGATDYTEQELQDQKNYSSEIEAMPEEAKAASGGESTAERVTPEQLGAKPKDVVTPAKDIATPAEARDAADVADAAKATESKLAESEARIAEKATAENITVEVAKAKIKNLADRIASNRTDFNGQELIDLKNYLPEVEAAIKSMFEATATGASAAFAATMGDNYNQMMKDSGGKADPMKAWIASASAAMTQALSEAESGNAINLDENTTVVKMDLPADMVASLYARPRKIADNKVMLCDRRGNVIVIDYAGLNRYAVNPELIEDVRDELEQKAKEAGKIEAFPGSDILTPGEQEAAAKGELAVNNKAELDKAVQQYRLISRQTEVARNDRPLVAEGVQKKYSGSKDPISSKERARLMDEWKNRMLVGKEEAAVRREFASSVTETKVERKAFVRNEWGMAEVKRLNRFRMMSERRQSRFISRLRNAGKIDFYKKEMSHIQSEDFIRRFDARQARQAPFSVRPEVMAKMDAGPIAAQYYPEHNLCVYYTGADVGDVLHEWMHHLTMNGLLPTRINNSLKAYFGDWQQDEAALEDVANALIVYIRDKELPEGVDPSLTKSFKFLSGVFAHTWSNVKRRVLVEGNVEKDEGFKLSDEMTVVFDSFFGLANPSVLESIVGENLDMQMELGPRGNHAPYAGVNGEVKRSTLRLAVESYLSNIDQVSSKVELSEADNQSRNDDLDKLRLLLTDMDRIKEDRNSVIAEAGIIIDKWMPFVPSGMNRIIELAASISEPESSASIKEYEQSVAPFSEKEETQGDRRKKIIMTEAKRNWNALNNKLHSIYDTHEAFHDVAKAKYDPQNLDPEFSNENLTVEQLRSLVHDAAVAGIAEETDAPVDAIKEFLNGKYGVERKEDLPVEDQIKFSAEENGLLSALESESRVSPIDVVTLEKLVMSLDSRPTSRDVRETAGGGPMIYQTLKRGIKNIIKKSNKYTLNLANLCTFLDDGIENGAFTTLIYTPIEKVRKAWAREEVGFRNIIREELGIINLSEDFDFQDREFFFGEKKRRYTGAEIISIAQKIRNPLQRKALELSNDITQEDFKEIEKIAEENSVVKESIRILDKMYSLMYDFIAPVYLERTGTPLNKTAFYSTIIRENGIVPENDMLSQIVPELTIGKMSTDNYAKHRSMLQGAKIRIDRPFDILRNYIRQVCIYVHAADVLDDITKVTTSDDLRMSMREKFDGSDDYFNSLNSALRRERFHNARESALDDSEVLLRAGRTKASMALIGGRLTTIPRAMASGFTALARMPGGSFKNIANYAKHFRKIASVMARNSTKADSGMDLLKGLMVTLSDGSEISVEEALMEWYPQIFLRHPDPIMEDQNQMGMTGFSAKRFPKYIPMIGGARVGNVQVGGVKDADLLTVVSSWLTAFDAWKGVNSSLGLSSKESDSRAAYEATDNVTKSQPSSLPHERNALQQSNEYVRGMIILSGFTMNNWQFFQTDVIGPLVKSARTGYKEGGSMGVVRAGLKAMGEKKESQNPMWYKLAMGFAVPGLAMGLIARRRPPDKREMIADMLLYPLSSFPIIGNAITNSVLYGGAFQVTPVYVEFANKVIGSMSMILNWDFNEHSIDESLELIAMWNGFSTYMTGVTANAVRLIANGDGLKFFEAPTLRDTFNLKIMPTREEREAMSGGLN